MSTSAPIEARRTRSSHRGEPRLQIQRTVRWHMLSIVDGSFPPIAATALMSAMGGKLTLAACGSYRPRRARIDTFGEKAGVDDRCVWHRSDLLE